MYESLLTPFKLKSLQLRNRLVMAPMTRNKSPGHIPGEDVAAYYRKRAEGNVGLIITEGTWVAHKAAQGYPDVPSLCGEEPLKAWKRVVDGVHAAQGKIFPQLWHVGSVRQSYLHPSLGCDNPSKVTECENMKIGGYAPSPIPHPYLENGEVPHEMTKKDIREVIDGFARSANEAKKIGFDGVEIHGAHGYLVDQFFWDYTNRRSDEYGGKTLKERARFGVELVQAIRQIVGEDFPICFRFSQWKLGDYEAKLAKSPEELESLLIPLARAGVDLFHCSTRRFFEPEFPDSSLNLAGWTKKLTRKPTITVGSIGLDNDFIATMVEQQEPHKALQSVQEVVARFDNKEFDLVAVGRALLADADWFQKTVTGEFEQIRPFSKELVKEL